jgi:predicted MFS family arabinose efflux permease
MSSLSLSEGTKAPPFALNLAVFAAGFATFINMWCTQSILPQLAAAFHVSQAKTGLIVTAPLVATAMMAPIIGAVSDRFGRKNLVLGAAVLLVIPTALVADAQNFATMTALRFLQGLMLPFIFTITIAYIGDETSGANTARLAGTYTSGAIFGGFSGRLVSGLVTAATDWRVALLVVAAMTLTMAVIIGVAMPKEQNFRPLYGFGRAMRSFPMHMTNKRLLATFAVGFGVLFSLVAVFTYINFRLSAAPYHMGPAALGAIFVVYLGGVVMSPIAARLSTRFGRKRVMTLAAPIIAAGLLLTLAGPLWSIILGLLLISSAIFVQQTLATAFVGAAAREGKSTAVGLYVTFYYIGGSAGGLAPAGVWHTYGWPGCVALVAIVQAIMLATALRYWSLPPVGPLSSQVRPGGSAPSRGTRASGATTPVKG